MLSMLPGQLFMLFKPCFPAALVYEGFVSWGDQQCVCTCDTTTSCAICLTSVSLNHVYPSNIGLQGFCTPLLQKLTGTVMLCAPFGASILS